MNIVEEIESTTGPSPIVFSENKKNTQSNDLGFLDFKTIDFKTFIIFFLLVLVAFTYFGINVLKIFGEGIEVGVFYATPFITSILKTAGYSSGTAINTVADITADATKVGVDIAEGTVKNVGNLLIGENDINQGPLSAHQQQDPNPSSPEDNIQKSVTATKSKWCLAGEYQNKRGCIDISESDKCMSGEVFPNEQLCLRGQMFSSQQQ